MSALTSKERVAELAKLAADFFNAMPLKAVNDVDPSLAENFGRLMVENGYRVVFNRWYLQAEPKPTAHEPRALPPLAEWFLVGEARRSWPDDKRLVQWEDYMALREFIENDRAAPCPQCIHGDGTHEATCPIRPECRHLCGLVDGYCVDCSKQVQPASAQPPGESLLAAAKAVDAAVQASHRPEDWFEPLALLHHAINGTTRPAPPWVRSTSTKEVQRPACTCERDPDMCLIHG